MSVPCSCSNEVVLIPVPRGKLCDYFTSELSQKYCRTYNSGVGFNLFVTAFFFINAPTEN